MQNVPAPTGAVDAPLKALIFDSQYDAYRGVVVYFRIMEGRLTTGTAGEAHGLRSRVQGH